MEKFSIVVDDSILKKLIAKLINRSASFGYDPKPDGKSEISVKPEQEQWLKNTITKLLF